MRRKISQLLLAMATIAFASALAVPTLAFAGGKVATVEDHNGNLTEYASLQEAFDAAALAGDPETEWSDYTVVYLHQDVDLGSAGLVVPGTGDVDLYVEMGGHEITSSNSQYTVKVEADAMVQFIDGIIVNTSSYGKCVVLNEGWFILSEPESTERDTSCALVARAGVDCALLNQPHGFANLELGVVKGGDYAIITHGELWIYDTIITGDIITDDLVADPEDELYSPYTVILSGEVNGGLVCTDANDGADVSIDGGRFSNDPSEFVSDLGEYHAVFGPVDGYYVVSTIEPKYFEDCPKDEDCNLAFYKDTKPTAWYHDGLEWANSTGVITGYTTADNPWIAEKLGPLDNVTREQFAVMMYRFADMRNFDMSMGDLMELDFKDAGKVSSWAEQSVKWAYGIGLIRGYGDGSILGPQDKLTREQLAVMLYRFAEYAQMDTSVGEDTNILSYKDFEKIGDYAIESMQWAVGSGVITGHLDKSGKPTGYIDPKGGALRAQVGTMLMRFYYL
ncbi:MAG: S-layer homology domain-containing protein [Eggerthellaceae bacterium]|nr:S-layer homology domain-containing protein [Eggerthellaceae bacterium]